MLYQPRVVVLSVALMHVHACVYHVCTLVVPRCWTLVLPCGAARLIKSTMRLNHREEQNSGGLSHEKCTGEAALSPGPCAGAVCVPLHPFDVAH